MSVLIALYVVAGLLELVGLGFAAVGFRQTWSEFGTAELTLRSATLKPVAEWLAARRAAAAVRVKRLFGKRGEGATIRVGTSRAIAFMTGGSVQARVAFGPLPPLDQPDEHVAEVHRRIQQLHEQLQAAREHIQREERAREAAERNVQEALRQEVRRVEGLSREVAVGGLVLQLWGWLFLIAGVVLGTLGNILGA